MNDKELLQVFRYKNNHAWHKVCITIIDYWVAPDMRPNALHMLRMAMMEAEGSSGDSVGASAPVAIDP